MVTLPSVQHSQVCLFFILIFPPLTLYISCLHIGSHVKNYRNPVIQRYCIRISILVPVYLVAALISLWIPTKTVWIVEMLKAGYEAFALYSFMALMLAFVGGPACLVDLWESEGRYLTGDWVTGTCIHGTMKLDGLFLKRLVQGVIQFVIVRLLIVVTVPILIAKDVFAEGKARFDRGWLYIMFIHNASLWVCLYSLWLFFLATKHYLRPFSPVLKFGLIKGIIFISFWQLIVLQILVASELVKIPPEFSERYIIDGWNNFLIILECLPLAILNFIAFSSKTGQYDSEWGTWRMLMEHGNVKNANSFPVNGQDAGKPDEEFQAVKPLAAFSHAVDAGDVFQHAFSTFSNYYGRHRYLALELSQRDSASATTTPLPTSKPPPRYDSL